MLLYVLMIAKVNVLERLQIKPGTFMIEGLKNIDNDRIRKAEKEAEEQNTRQRDKRRLLKRK